MLKRETLSLAGSWDFKYIKDIKVTILPLEELLPIGARTNSGKAAGVVWINLPSGSRGKSDFPKGRSPEGKSDHRGTSRQNFGTGPVGIKLG